MKKFTIILILLISICKLSAQYKFNTEGCVSKAIRSATSGQKIPEGQILRNFETIIDQSSKYPYVVSDLEGVRVVLKRYDMSKIAFRQAKSKDEIWAQAYLKYAIENAVLYDEIRIPYYKELEAESSEFIQNLHLNNFILKDAYMEDYLQRLANNIWENDPLNKLHSHIKVLIINYKIPKIFCLPEGTLLISSGLLSLVESESELTAIMVSEIAHFLLDHQFYNCKHQESREDRSIFWSDLSAMMAAQSSIYLDTSKDGYTGGSLISSVALMSTTIANYAEKRLGLKYTKEQKLEADKTARIFLDFIHIDSAFLNQALTRIYQYYIDENLTKALGIYGSEAFLKERISSKDKPSLQTISEPAFQSATSLANTLSAVVYLMEKDYRKAIVLSQKNIDSNIADEADYMIKVNAMLELNDSEKNNREMYNLLQEAKMLNINPQYDLPKLEALVLIRMKDYQGATEALNVYKQELLNMQADLLVYKEIEWTRNLLMKLAILE